VEVCLAHAMTTTRYEFTIIPLCIRTVDGYQNLEQFCRDLE
jgi:hypothetical protein